MHVISFEISRYLRYRYLLMSDLRVVENFFVYVVTTSLLCVVRGSVSLGWKKTRAKVYLMRVIFLTK